MVRQSLKHDPVGAIRLVVTACMRFQLLDRIKAVPMKRWSPPLSRMHAVTTSRTTILGRCMKYGRTVRRRGVTLVETAIVIGACLLFMFAIFEYGRVIMLRQLLANATREAARYAVWNTNTQPTPNLQNYMTAYLASQPLTITSFNAFQADPNNNYANLGPWQNAGFGQPIVVKVQASYSPILPSLGFLPNPVTLKDEATMYSEGF